MLQVVSVEKIGEFGDAEAVCPGMRDRLAYGLAAAAHGGVLVLALMTVGCAGVKPAPSAAPVDASAAPKAVATKPPDAAPAKSEVVARPVAKPAAPVVEPVVQGPAKVNAPAASAPPKAAPVPVEPAARKEVTPPAAKPAPAPAPKSSPPLDLATLEKRLKETPAIGLLTKLTLKNQVDELLDRFRAHYEGRISTTLAQLRPPYDLLILKVLSLLQDRDPSLARAVADSREAIWGILADPDKFNDL